MAQPLGLSHERLADPEHVAFTISILRSYERLNYLSRRLAERGLDRVAEHIRDNLLPGPGRQRIGDFGELVATAVFRRLKRYTVPVLKLRFKLDPNESQRLIDVVAFHNLGRPGHVVWP